MKTPASVQPPTILVVAAALTALEGIFFVGYGVLELVNTAGSRLAVGLTTAVFFAMYGAGLVACAWMAHRGSPWARSPIMLAQLIQLGVAWSFRSGETAPVAAALFVVAVVTLIGVLHPASTAYLVEDDAE